MQPTTSADSMARRGGRTPPLVYIVDDDAFVLTSLRRLIESMGYRVRTFTSAEAFVRRHHHHRRGTACLLLDVQLPGMDGFDLQRNLAVSGCELPIVFMTAHDTPVVQARAMAAGAVAFLAKPLDDEALSDAIRAALARGAVCARGG
jgi:FixJ family two-component response regulator